MKNEAVLTEFILLGLTDVPELQVIVFIFLLLTYLLQHHWKPDNPHPHLAGLSSSDPHVFLSPKLLLLRNFLQSIFIPRVLISITTGTRVSALLATLLQYFFCHIPRGHGVLPSGCHVL